MNEVFHFIKQEDGLPTVCYIRIVNKVLDEHKTEFEFLKRKITDLGFSLRVMENKRERNKLQIQKCAETLRGKCR